MKISALLVLACNFQWEISNNRSIYRSASCKLERSSLCEILRQGVSGIIAVATAVVIKKICLVKENF